MRDTTAAVPRIVPQFGRDGRPAWYVVEAPDGTRIDFPCGLKVIGGRLDTDDDTPGQLMVHVHTEAVGEADTYGADHGMPKLVVSVNDGEVYDDHGNGNVADPIDAVVYVVDTTEGPIVFVDAEQAKTYAEFWGHAWWPQGTDVLGRHAGAVFVRESTDEELEAAA